MKTLFATTTALLVATAAPTIAGDKYKKDMDGQAATMTMEETMQKKQAMDMKQTNNTAAKYARNDTFATIDTNANGEVDFTEFSMFMESKGYDVADSAKEYVKLTGGGSDVITDRTFAGVDIANLPHKHMDDGTVHNMDKTQSASMQSPATETMSVSTQPTAVMGSTITTDDMSVGGAVTMDYSSRYGSFSDYDMNADGRVDFREYSKARSKSGITTTAAAQEFIRFSDGQQSFDQARFDIAASQDVLSQKYYRATPRS